MVATTLLSAISVAIQSSIDCFRPGSKDPLPVNLMTAIVAGRGEKKSRTERSLLEPIREFESSFEEENKFKLEKYESELRQWKSKVKKAEKNTAETETEESFDCLNSLLEQKPSRPRHTRFLYGRCTINSLLDSLNENWSSAGIFDSDADNQFSRSSVLASPSDLTKLYDGDTVSSKSISRGELLARNPRVTVALGLQNDVFSEILRSNKCSIHSTGLLSRILVWTNEGPYYRVIIPDDTEGAIERYRRRILKLVQEQKKRVDEKLQPQKMHLAPDAAKAWYAYTDEINENYGLCETAGVSGFSNRLSDNCLKIAGLIEYFETGKLSISLRSMNHSIDLCRMYMFHSFITGKIVRSSKQQALGETLLTCLHQLLRQYQTSIVVRGEINQFGPNSIRSTHSRNIAINEIRDHVFETKIHGKSCIGLKGDETNAAYLTHFRFLTSRI